MQLFGFLRPVAGLGLGFALTSFWLKVHHLLPHVVALHPLAWLLLLVVPSVAVPLVLALLLASMSAKVQQVPLEAAVL